MTSLDELRHEPSSGGTRSPGDEDFHGLPPFGRWASVFKPPIEAWLRLPRRTARLRLTILYGALFLVSGAALLTVTYLLFERATGQQRGEISTPSTSPGLPTTKMHQTLNAATRAAAVAQNAADKHDLLINSGIALAIVAALAVLLGWFFAGRVLRPVRTIAATARRISATNLDERLALDDADDEFRQLGDTLDDLFARLAAAFDAQRHFVANASHELRTPLTAERTLLQVALANPATTAERWRTTGQELLASSQEQERLIEALLTLASSEGGLDHRERIDLSEICDHVLLRPDLDIDTLSLHVETTIRPAPLEGDPRLVERLVANLVHNAIGHNVGGGQVRISTSVIDGNATLSVTNTGPAIPPGEVDRLFQPFQRLDPHRTHNKDGHGLGLSIVAAIATAHGATTTAQPRQQGGLTVTVTFPPPSKSERAADNEAGAHRPHQRSARGERESQAHPGNQEPLAEVAKGTTPPLDP